MPYSGNTYSVPGGTTATTLTPVSSAVYNAFVADIEEAQNHQRPVVGGGTGAGTAVEGHDNLTTISSNIASATTTDLSTATGIHVTITGTTTITGFGTEQAGAVRFLVFSGSLTLTHNGTSLILPGGVNIVTQANDTALMESLGSGNWRCLSFQRYVASGQIEAKGADMASASTVDLSTATGRYVHITGTTTITAFGTCLAGVVRLLEFAGALTLTHNATSLILPGGANITTAAGDMAVMVSEGSGNWRCVCYQPATGQSIISSTTYMTPVATTSGTSKDVTGIPSNAKRITIHFASVSTNGTSVPMLQIGDSGGIETSGYTAEAGNGSSTNLFSSATASGAGFPLTASWAATASLVGYVELVRYNNSDTWYIGGTYGRGDVATLHFAAGNKAVSANLDRIRLTTVGGTDAFDSGEFAVSYQI